MSHRPPQVPLTESAQLVMMSIERSGKLTGERAKSVRSFAEHIAAERSRHFHVPALVQAADLLSAVAGIPGGEVLADGILQELAPGEPIVPHLTHE